jgi:hypothetical protein
MHIGFRNTVPWPRVAAILAPGGASMKRLRAEAAAAQRLINACAGRKCLSMIVTDSNHVILAAVTPETLRARLTEARWVEGRVNGHA